MISKIIGLLFFIFVLFPLIYKYIKRVINTLFNEFNEDTLETDLNNYKEKEIKLDSHIKEEEINITNKINNFNKIKNERNKK